MRSALITAPGVVEVVESEPRRPGEGEAMIRVELVGVCATDVHILHGTFPTASYPVRPGHEATGVVEALGPDVTSLAIGDRVVLDPGIPCGTCHSCRDGRLNLCEDRHAYGVDRLGACAETITAPAANFLPVGELPFRSAVLGEPLACVVHGFDLVPDIAARRVLVIGAGTIGLLAMLLAKARGAAEAAVLDRNVERLALAESLGADEVVDRPESLARQEWDLVVDATGVPAAISGGLERLRRGGTLLQLGVADPERTLPLSPYQVFARELRIQGSMTTRHSFPRAIELLRGGLVDGTRLTTEPYDLADYAAAIAQAGTGVIPKVVVTPRARHSTQ